MGSDQIKMSIQRSSPLSLQTLIILLCLGSLVILPVPIIADLSTTEVSGIDFENYSQFDPTDFDEEISITALISAIIDGLPSSKSRPLNLDIPTSCLSPESPPPE
jgi:hypothetical protein